MGRPRNDGTKIDNAMRRRGILLAHLHEQADGQNCWFGFSAQSYALDRGENTVTILSDLRKFQEEGKIELEIRQGAGTLIRFPEPPEKPVEAGAEEAKANTYRKCPRCSTVAPDASARFCWKCGASLLSEKELLKEAFDRVFPKIARALTGSDANEIMTVIGNVGQLAFKEE